ncbi:MAG: iron-containing alcohol dehydrogenase [Actinomycetota bacterium]|nr:iron-containing alcohol dehydrogenase [Actinomycetota bacterium]MDA3028605.1 iron-containing alcohol dehydrogenase [Actinomycetota bacterium]
MYQLPKQPLAGQFTFLPIDDVYFGSGAVESLGPALEANGVERAVLITGNTLALKTNLVDKVCAAAGGRIAGVFHETQMHVHSESVLRAAEYARSIGADGVVSFGGGTANDTGKAVVLALAENIVDRSGFQAARTKFEYPATIEVPPVKGDALPLIAVSTTLSGGECTHFIGITDEVRDVKDLYIDKKLTAKAIILDPDLTLETPEWLWLSTGMRSVDHCIEAMCSLNSHPYTDALAAHALGMLNRYLRECKADPEDLVARTNAHVAAWMSVSGLANVQLGLSHGIGHQLGARNNVPHGVTSCVMMGAVMDWNQDHVGDKQVWIAEIMGVDTSTMSDAEARAAGREAIVQLVKDLDQPYRLRDVGVERSDFGVLANDALQDMIVATNPRPVASVDDVVEVLEMAY